jgi:hypothetical protein
MSKQEILATALILLLGVSSAWLYGQHSLPRQVVAQTVTLYVQGNRRELPTTSPVSLEIQRSTQDLFTHSSNVLYEAIFPETVNAIRSAGAVEIVYSSPVVFHLSNPAIQRSSIAIDHLLVSLAPGEYAGWILYGTGGYSSGPFVTIDSTAITSLRTLVTGD